MGGHGGLNILPQKRWNVYNFENREKVRKDEEEAAREEQLKQEQSRRRDAEFRLERLRQARGLASSSSSSSAAAAAAAPSPPPSSDSHHINLFEGLQDFPSLAEPDLPTAAADGAQRGGGKKNPTRDEGSGRDPKRKREDRPVVISPEDEKYRMGYGVAGKGVKAPWYLSRPTLGDAADGSDEGRDPSRGRVGDSSKKEAGGKRTIEELREERLKRERREKERERAVLVSARRERRGIGWNGCERKLR